MGAAAEVERFAREVAKRQEQKRADHWDAPPPEDSVLGELAEPGESARSVLHRVALAGYDDRGVAVISAQGVETIARRCLINDKDTPRRIPWDPHPEQIASWETLEQEDWAYILKSRQVGQTTGIILHDVVWTAVMDSLLNPVHTALIWNTGPKTKEQVLRAGDLAVQLGAPLRKDPGVEVIWFANGARIQGYTAGEQGSSRSLSFDRGHLSELPSWRQATVTWAALQPSLGNGSPLVIETTMEMKDPLASDLWAAPNQFAKVFYPFEMHTAYRLPADDLPDHAWEWLSQEEGFTSRESAAWWWDYLQNRMNGDVKSMMREFPQLERHAFTLSQGLWYQVIPQVLAPCHVTRLDSLDGSRQWEIDWYQDPEDCSGQFAIGVDTAEGGGGDRSVAICIDKRDLSIVGAFAHNFALRDDLAAVTQKMWEMLRHVISHRKNLGRWQPVADPDVFVETNGPGKYTYSALAELGVNPTRFQTGVSGDKVGARNYEVLLASKRAVEAGHCFGPKVLEEESKSVHRPVSAEGKTGDFKGWKDMSMALGFCLVGLRHSPYLPEPVKPVSPLEVYRAPVDDPFEAKRGRGGF